MRVHTVVWLTVGVGLPVILTWALTLGSTGLIASMVVLVATVAWVMVLADVTMQAVQWPERLRQRVHLSWARISLVLGLVSAAFVIVTVPLASPRRDVVRPDFVMEPTYRMLHWAAPDTAPDSARGTCLRVRGTDGAADRRIAGPFVDIRGVDWSPDGEWLVFQGERYRLSGDYSGSTVYLAKSRGGRVRRISGPPEHSNAYKTYWSPDSTTIALLDEGQSHITLVSVDSLAHQELEMRPPPWWPRPPGDLDTGVNWLMMRPRPTTLGAGAEWMTLDRRKVAYTAPDSPPPLQLAWPALLILVCGGAAPLAVCAGIRSRRSEGRSPSSTVGTLAGALGCAALAMVPIEFVQRVFDEALSHVM